MIKFQTKEDMQKCHKDAWAAHKAEYPDREAVTDEGIIGRVDGVLAPHNCRTTQLFEPIEEKLVDVLCKENDIPANFKSAEALAKYKAQLVP